MALTDKLTAIANAIRAKTGKSDSLTLDQMPTEIANIETGGGGGEKPFDCHSVTFVYGDKSYVRSVADGDTCADPVSRGLISAPTKESTAQYNYTFYGWGASDGGAADANILKNITEDKTVYAIFTATVRYYTITYYDEDGTTVLATKQVPYGTVPSYTPTKEGVSFDGWTPTPVAVTGDASYTAKWLEKVTFANGSWADIARISEAGEASQYFAVGDKRVENFGTYGSVTLMILGFDHDDLADGSGKAGISIGMTTMVQYDSTTLGKYKLSSELQAVMKKVTYPTYNNGSSSTTTSDVVAYSWGEVGKSYKADGCTAYAKYPTSTDFGSFKYVRFRGYVTDTQGNANIYLYNGNVSKGRNTETKYFMGHFCV